MHYVPNYTPLQVNMSNDVAIGEFSAFSYNCGHPDVALAVHITKRLEHIIRKYFCRGRVCDKRITLGKIINTHSDFGVNHGEIARCLMSIVFKRNDLVHKFEVNRFENESSRNAFIETSNLVLKILEMNSVQCKLHSAFEFLGFRRASEDQVVQMGEQDRQSFGDGLVHQSVKTQSGGSFFQTADFPTADSEGFVVQSNFSKFKIKKPGENSSLYELSDFHCWNMIKMDLSLQKSISEDVDGLFEGLLPIPFEEYLSTVPS